MAAFQYLIFFPCFLYYEGFSDADRRKMNVGRIALISDSTSFKADLPSWYKIK